LACCCGFAVVFVVLASLYKANKKLYLLCNIIRFRIIFIMVSKNIIKKFLSIDLEEKWKHNWISSPISFAQ
jgi:hypothetical protein